jgi:hypothetical protein
MRNRSHLPARSFAVALLRCEGGEFCIYRAVVDEEREVSMGFDSKDEGVAAVRRWLFKVT